MEATTMKTELILNTGNVIKEQHKPTPTYQEEYTDSLRRALFYKKWNQVIPDKRLMAQTNVNNSGSTSIDFTSTTSQQQQQPQEKIHLLKVVLYLSVEAKPEHVQQAIYTTLNNLGTNQIDQLLLRVPPDHPNFKSLWTAVESIKDLDVINEIGVVNLNQGELKTLLSYCKHRPSANRIKMNILGKLDQELIDFCKQENIKLLAGHTFEIDSLNEKTRKLLVKHLNVSPQVTSSWCVMYNVIHKYHNIIKNRGYILQCMDTEQ